MKIPDPEPEPDMEAVVEEVAEAAPEPEPESLLGDLGEAVMPVKKEPAPLPLKADMALLSEESLYADDDPLDKLKPQKKGMSASGSSASASKVSAKISNRNLGAVPGKISNRSLPPVEKNEPEAEVVEEVAEEAPKSNKKMMPAKGSARGIAPASKRGIPPAKAAEEAPVEEAAAEEAPAEGLALQEEAAQEEAAPAGKKSASSRMQRRDSRIIKGSGRKAVAKEPEPAEEEPSSKSGRRRSVRGAKPKGFTKMQKILAGVAFLLVLVVVVGYSPFMNYWLVNKKFLAEGASVDERKRAADNLFDYYRDSTGVPLGVFCQYAKSADATIREASIYGLELCGSLPVLRSDVITEIGSDLKAADASTKLQLIHAAGAVAKAASKMPEEKTPEKKDEQIKKDNEDLSHIADVLLPLSDVGREPELNIRTAAVDAMSSLRVPGVCQQMIKIAESPDTGLIAKARGAIMSTALPEAAAELLDAMGKPDTDLQKTAQAAFANVCDAAKSEVIARAVNNEVPEVRAAVVKALSVRKADTAAAAGLMRALKDKSPDIRAMAVAGIPTTGLPTGSASQLIPLVTDENDAVRIATADALGKLKDDATQKIVIEAFKNEMKGAVQQAYIKALGLRCPNKATQLQDSLKAIKIVMDVLEASPDSAQNIVEALALLTAANGGSARINERKGWSVDRWKAWYKNITEREAIRTDVMAKIEELRKKKDDNHNTFERLFHETEKQLDLLQKCIDMSQKDDPEDMPPMNADLSKFQVLKMHFEKNASINERN